MVLPFHWNLFGVFLAENLHSTIYFLQFYNKVLKMEFVNFSNGLYNEQKGSTWKNCLEAYL